MGSRSAANGNERLFERAPRSWTGLPAQRQFELGALDQFSAHKSTKLPTLAARHSIHREYSSSLRVGLPAVVAPNNVFQSARTDGPYTPSYSRGRRSVPPSAIPAPHPNCACEDAIIHSRITNDERALRRVIKKFTSYAGARVAPEPAPPAPPSTAVEDAREAFLVELESFSLQLQKAVMVCEAEARQVEEYQRERLRIEDEHGSLTGHIEQLKTSLEHAQIERRRKIEYDVFAEKINTLPSRTELEHSIQLLENDISAIRADHDAQTRLIQTQRASLMTIISDLGSLRLMGKDKDAEPSRATTPAADSAMADAEPSRSPIAIEIEDEKEEGEEGEEREDVLESDLPSSDDVPLSATLNPQAKSFVPSRSSPAVPILRAPRPPASSATPSRAEDDDIEMGELTEEPAHSKKKARDEELEEGEASDESSELSDPPDD
ncbi:hypothetical protein FA95DRAFT_1487712 [Auriscalpium vulgare]|uniref:Uncharacterized protein n=1 Tax=Auriscalpium vulgare TaxID=40419 RepID=A0ACB8S1J6_9AGAM|nr:hypothetical protein FA95DRAFT_1487712 [Auriscalpium vulgare]